MAKGYTPELRSEVSTRLIGRHPRLREVFAQGEITLSGAQLERWMQIAWVAGFGQGVISDPYDEIRLIIERDIGRRKK